MEVAHRARANVRHKYSPVWQSLCTSRPFVCKERAFHLNMPGSVSHNGSSRCCRIRLWRPYSEHTDRSTDTALFSRNRCLAPRYPRLSPVFFSMETFMRLIVKMYVLNWRLEFCTVYRKVRRINRLHPLLPVIRNINS